jgi:hypothetical protein
MSVVALEGYKSQDSRLTQYHLSPVRLEDCDPLLGTVLTLLSSFVRCCSAVLCGGGFEGCELEEEATGNGRGRGRGGGDGGGGSRLI